MTGKAPKPPATLRLERLTKRFRTPESREITAVDDVTLDIEGGAFVTLLGPSGCGKTTTLRMIAGFEVPTLGRILLDGRDISRLTPDKRGMGMVFQSYALFPHLSVFENVAYGMRLRHRSGADLGHAVERTLQLVNLPGLGQRRPSELSGGQQQRVALARAMAIEPRVLLFDEPLSNLDAKLRVSLRSEIRRIQRQLGITSIYVTHDQSEAMALSDLVVVMNAGRVEQAGPPDEIYRRPASRFVADFIGRANFVDGTVQSVTDGSIEIDLLGQRLHVPASPGHVVGAQATVVVRPESVRVGSGELRASVRGSTFLGSMVEYELETDGEAVLAVDPDWMSRGLYAPGERVAWSLMTSHAYALPPGTSAAWTGDGEESIGPAVSAATDE
jgi:iron(III) transport system ATP-binding protein